MESQRSQFHLPWTCGWSAHRAVSFLPPVYGIYIQMDTCIMHYVQYIHTDGHMYYAHIHMTLYVYMYMTLCNSNDILLHVRIYCIYINEEI